MNITDDGLPVSAGHLHAERSLFLRVELSRQPRSFPLLPFRFSEPYALSLRVEGRGEGLLRELSDELELLDEPDLLGELESLERPNLLEESVLLIG